MDSQRRSRNGKNDIASAVLAAYLSSCSPQVADTGFVVALPIPDLGAEGLGNCCRIGSPGRHGAGSAHPRRASGPGRNWRLPSSSSTRTCLRTRPETWREPYSSVWAWWTKAGPEGSPSFLGSTASRWLDLRPGLHRSLCHGRHAGGDAGDGFDRRAGARRSGSDRKPGLPYGGVSWE